MLSKNKNEQLQSFIFNLTPKCPELKKPQRVGLILLVTPIREQPIEALKRVPNYNTPYLHNTAE